MLLILLGYLCALMLLGAWIGRRVRTSGEFFVAGRQLGPGLLFSTLVAANIGAGSTVGAAGLGYRDGISAWWWVGSAGLGSLVLAFTVGPRMRRIAADFGFHTVGDFLERRYGRGVRAIVAVLLGAGGVAILAGQLIALAWVLNVAMGLPKTAGCLVGGVVVTTYFAAGSLVTSAWVNVVQVVVKLAGFAIALPLAAAAAGGWHGVADATPGGSYWSFWRGGASGWGYLALVAPAFVVSPGLLQKIYGARDDRAVRLAVASNAAVLLLFAVVPPFLGMVARALHPHLTHHELALPTVLMRDVPPLVGGLGLAAVVSAEISAADAILFMLATSLSRDLYRGFLRRDASDRQVLAAARSAAVAGGVLGVSLAIVAPSVIDVLGVFYTLLTVCLFVPVVAGLYWRRTGTTEVLAAMGGGVTAFLAAQVATGGAGFGPLSPQLAGLLCACFACAAAVALRRRPRRFLTPP